MTSIQRFHAAQDQRHAGYAEALAEMRAGAKHGHWIWYVFPQLYGLGVSSHARAYGIRGVAEATDYLHDPVLRSRLLEISTAVAEQVRQGTRLETLMGSSIDVLKLVSSLTLFGSVARRLARGEGGDDYEALARITDEVLAAAAAEGHPACERTTEALNKTA